MTNDQQQTVTRAATLTTPSDREIVTERVFDAPRERVFAAFTDPELIPEWSRGLAARADRPDVRVGRDARPRRRGDRDVRGVGGRTKVTNNSLFHTSEERDGMLESGMEGGLNESYERLDWLLAKLG
jgi:uncharacterized protein YndB with AHSA1/START domain